MNLKEFAELVRLRPDLARKFHFVRAGRDGRAGFYRRIPITYGDRRARPASQLRVQLAFGEAAYRAYGTKGSVEHKGIMISKPAAEIHKEMKGKSYRKRKWELAIEKLTVAMKEVIEVTRET